MHGYVEIADHFLLGYSNGVPVVLEQKDCLNTVIEEKPDVVHVMLKTTIIGEFVNFN